MKPVAFLRRRGQSTYDTVKAKRGVGVTGPLMSPLPFPSCETFTSLLTFQAASFLTCEMGERMFIQTNSVLSVN